MWLRISWRNLWRNLRRTLLTITAISLGHALLIVMISMMIGFNEMMLEQMTRSGMGNVQLHHPDYLEKKSADLIMSDAAELTAIIEATDGVSGVSPRLLFSGALRSSTSSAVGVVKILAVDPEREARMSVFAGRVIAGGFVVPPPGTQEPDAPLRIRSRRGILLGAKLADHLKVELGSKVRLDTAGLQGGTVASAFRVTGIFKTGSINFDNHLVLVSLDGMQALTGAGDAAHELSVVVSDPERTEEVVASIRAAMGDRALVAVQPWWEVSPNIKKMLDLSGAWSALFYLLMMIVLSGGILATMFMVVYERRREFGVQLALGTERGLIFRCIMLEALWIALISASIGLVLGGVSVYFLEKYGIDLSFAVGGFDLQGVFIDRVYRGSSNPKVFIEPTLVVIAGTLLFTLWPAARVARMKALDAIRQGGN